MDLPAQYTQQYQWRDWPGAYAVLPNLNGKRVLDLGCAIGDQSRDFAEQGAWVTGMDQNPDLLAIARRRAIPRARFIQGDLSQLGGLQKASCDLIWSSFTLAYLTDQAAHIADWQHYLKPGGYLCLIEVADLLAHAPLPEHWRAEVLVFYRRAGAAKRYDFMAGEHLGESVNASGLRLRHQQTLPDRELAFDGAAPAAVYEAWRLRLARMPALVKDLGTAFVEDFLATLRAPTHRSDSRVHLVLAQR